MKFFKTKATALSIALLLSTQTIKPMGGVDFGIDAEDVGTSTSTLTEKAQSLLNQAKQTYNSAVTTATPYATNALGIAVNGSRSAYNAAAANPVLSAGIAAGTIGAGVLTYKKPHVAGGIATAGIALGTAGLIAHDNPELVQAGKDKAIQVGNALVNAGKAVADFAVTNAPVVYNAATQNIIADYMRQNSEIVVPAVIAGTVATYFGYTPAKNAVKKLGTKVAKAAKVVAPYAAKAAAVAAPVAAAAAVVKYSPETAQAVKNAVIDGGNAALAMGQNMAQAVVANTPEIVKENPALTVIGAGAAGYAAKQAYPYAERGARKTVEVVSNNAGKIAVAGTVAGVAGLIAYDNQESIVAGKDAAIAMAKDAFNAIVNADYAQYTQNTFDAVKPAGAFVAKKASSLKVNGARMVNAARNLDYRKMAENAGKYLNAHKNEVVGSTLASAGIATTGYMARKVMEEKEANAVYDNLVNSAASVKPTIMVPMTEVGQELKQASLLKPVELPAKKHVHFAPDAELVSVRSIEKRSKSESAVETPNAESVPVQSKAPELDPAMTLLPGSEAVTPVVNNEQTHNLVTSHHSQMTQLVLRPEPAQESKVVTIPLRVTLENETSNVVARKRVVLTPVTKPAPAQPKVQAEPILVTAKNQVAQAIEYVHNSCARQMREVELKELLKFRAQLNDANRRFALANLQAIAQRLNQICETKNIAPYRFTF